MPARQPGILAAHGDAMPRIVSARGFQTGHGVMPGVIPAYSHGRFDDALESCRAALAARPAHDARSG